LYAVGPPQVSVSAKNFLKNNQRFFEEKYLKNE